jgi:hypothetical protein
MISDDQAVISFKATMPLKLGFQNFRWNMVIFKIAREHVAIRRKIFLKWLKLAKARAFWRENGRPRRLD